MSFPETAKFPTAIATDVDMLTWQNVTPATVIPTLASAMGTTDTSLTLTAGTGASLPTSNFVISIDSEIIFVSSRSTDTLSITRSFEGTTATSHLLGAQVRQLVTAKSHNQIVSEINAIETSLGTHLQKVSRNSIATVTFGSTPTFDASTSDNFKMTLTGNVTSSTVANALAGQEIRFVLVQDATGGRTFVWPTSFKGGMTLDTGANKTNVQSFLYDGTNFYASSVGVSY